MLLTLCLAPATALAQRDVLAHGYRISDSIRPLWVASVDSTTPDAPNTTLLLRERFGDGRDWLQFRGLPTRVSALTGHAGELVVLLKAPSSQPRDWAWVSRSGDAERFSYGPSLPGKAAIRAIAGDAKSLWAITPPPPPATQPSTTMAVTMPTTRPQRPVLYKLTGETWDPQPAEWPDGIDITPADDISMAIIGGKPVIAVLTIDDGIQLLRLEAGAWKKLERVPLQNSLEPEQDYRLRAFKLLNIDEAPGLWLQPEHPEWPAGWLWTARTKHVKLALDGPAPSWRDVDVTVLGDQVRLFVRRGGILVEQRYGVENGKPTGQPQDVRVRKTRADGQMDTWFTISVTVLLSILVLNILMRRRASNRQDDDSGDSDE